MSNDICIFNINIIILVIFVIIIITINISNNISINNINIIILKSTWPPPLALNSHDLPTVAKYNQASQAPGRLVYVRNGTATVSPAAG